MTKLTVDRVTEGFAVCECEDLSHISIPVERFPFEVKEGMVISMKDDGTYLRDETLEDEKRRRIIELQNKLRSKQNIE